jgi:hypothetical protein
MKPCSKPTLDELNVGDNSAAAEDGGGGVMHALKHSKTWFPLATNALRFFRACCSAIFLSSELSGRGVDLNPPKADARTSAESLRDALKANPLIFRNVSKVSLPPSRRIPSIIRDILISFVRPGDLSFLTTNVRMKVSMKVLKNNEFLKQIK